MRDLYRTKEHDDRDKKRAADELARINGIVDGRPAPKPVEKPTPRARPKPAEASFEERKQQMAQLAAMGVAVPQEFRSQMGQTGEWETVSTRRIEPEPKEEDDEKDSKSFVDRNRKYEDDFEADAVYRDPSRPSAPQAIGSKRKAYQIDDQKDVDIGALLGGPAKETQASSSRPTKKRESEPGIKREDSEEKPAVEDAAPAVFFKKLKKKQAKT